MTTIDQRGGNDGVELRTSREIFEESTGVFETPDEMFIDAVLEELDTVREDLAEADRALPKDVAFVQALRGIKEAVLEGDIGRASSAHGTGWSTT